MNRTIPLLLVCFMSACDSTTLVDATSADSALQSAQCTYQNLDTAAGACRTTFESCIAAEGADVDACREALRACLPPPPQQVAGQGVGCSGGGGHGGRGGPDGGMAPPPPPRDGDGGPDGGMGPRGGGEGHGGPGHGGGGHGGPPRGEPRPPPEEVAACRTALDACLAAEGADREACLQTERDCVHAAFAAIFEARCTEERAACAAGELDATVCARIEERCTQGLDAVPQNADGTSACTTPVTP